MISDIIQTPRLLWPENDVLSCLVVNRPEISRTMNHTYVRTVDFRGKNMVTVEWSQPHRCFDCRDVGFARQWSALLQRAQSHSVSSSLAFQQQHWLSFLIQYFDSFAHWRFSVKESSLALLQYYRLVSTIQYSGHLIISQTVFGNDHYYHCLATSGQRAGCNFSLENQYLATFGRYLGGADFYSSKVIIW